MTTEPGRKRHALVFVLTSLALIAAAALVGKLVGVLL